MIQSKLLCRKKEDLLNPLHILESIKKEPSRKFFKIFFMLLIVNVVFSVSIFLVSPEQIPSRLTANGFEEYRSRNVLLSSAVFQVIILFLALPLYRIAPQIWKNFSDFFPRFQKIYLRCSRFMLGMKSDTLPAENILTRFISVIILTMSAYLILLNGIVLGFSLEVANLGAYIFPFIVLLIVLIIPVLRMFSSMMQ